MEFPVNRGLAARRRLPPAPMFLLALCSCIYGQQAPAQPPKPTPAQAPAPAPAKPMAQLPVVQDLRVMPLAGKGAMNDLERHVMTPLVVQVLDKNDRPV